MEPKRSGDADIQCRGGGHTSYSPGQIPGLRITAGIALPMASTSSPRKTPSARKRAAPRPTASDLAEAPVTAEDSVLGMRQLLASGPVNGSFLQYDGEPLDW